MGIGHFSRISPEMCWPCRTLLSLQAISCLEVGDRGGLTGGRWSCDQSFIRSHCTIHELRISCIRRKFDLSFVMVIYGYCRVQRQRLHSNRMSTRTYHNSKLNSFAPDLRLWCCHLSGVRSAKKSCGRPGITCWIWMESMKLPLSESTRSITKHLLNINIYKTYIKPILIGNLSWTFLADFLARSRSSRAMARPMRNRIFRSAVWPLINGPT